MPPMEDQRMLPVPDRATFENIYAGQTPWEIGRPQKAFLDVADRITGSVLDVGCGTGEDALCHYVEEWAIVPKPGGAVPGLLQ
jgi:hypothetical protein